MVEVSGFYLSDLHLAIYLISYQNLYFRLNYLQYYLFLWQKLRKWRLLKLIAGIIALIALYYGDNLIFYVGDSF
jgi:hypothetical protein